MSAPTSFSATAYARVGLVGNPSDGFHGKTIAVAVENFCATVAIHMSDAITFTPNPRCDATSGFTSLAELHGALARDGYQGGIVLLQATCKRFHEYCAERHLVLPSRNFTLSYDTNIPRQVGLAGSSAIITATLRCLLHFFEVSDEQMPLPLRPSFVLSVESGELSITAGLQDRVIQAYEGCMFMDFAKELLEGRGYGDYSRIPTATLPPLWLAFVKDPSNSGKIHSDVKARWLAGEAAVVDAMASFASLTDRAREALLAGDAAALGDAMRENFRLRRAVYGDACLGADNIAMVELAAAHGAPAKFSGSGGAVVGLSTGEEQSAVLEAAFKQHGFGFVRLVPHGA